MVKELSPTTFQCEKFGCGQIFISSEPSVYLREAAKNHEMSDSEHIFIADGDNGEWRLQIRDYGGISLAGEEEFASYRSAEVKKREIINELQEGQFVWLKR